MRDARATLISRLAREARPVPNGSRTRLEALLWLASVAGSSWLLLAATGPFRPGFATQLAGSPQLLIETLLGALAVAALARAAFRSALPDSVPVARRAAPALLLLALWIGCHLYGLIDPALTPSMAGKREHCAWETLLYGLPALAIGCWALRRWWPHGAWSGALLGLAAGSMPALLMQLACMYSPEHGLLHHLLPGLALALPGAAAGVLFLRRPGSG